MYSGLLLWVPEAVSRTSAKIGSTLNRVGHPEQIVDFSVTWPKVVSLKWEKPIPRAES